MNMASCSVHSEISVTPSSNAEERGSGFTHGDADGPQSALVYHRVDTFEQLGVSEEVVDTVAVRVVKRQASVSEGRSKRRGRLQQREGGAGVVQSSLSYIAVTHRG